jgi:tetratricopeptide (TPR) repeat protein
LDEVNSSAEKKTANFYLHLLLGDYAHGLLKANAPLERQAKKRYQEYYLGVVKRSETDWQTAEQELAQIRIAWERVDQENVSALYLWPSFGTAFLSRRGHWSDYSTWVETTLEAARRRNDPISISVQAWCEKWLGHRDEHFGLFNSALAHFDASLELFLASDDKFGQHGHTAALGNIERILDSIRNQSQGVADFPPELPPQNQLGQIATALNNIGEIYLNLKQFHKALEFFQPSLEIHRNIGNKSGIASVRNNIGLTYMQTNAQNEALESLSESLQLWQEIGDDNGRSATLENLGVLALSKGNISESIRCFEEGLMLARRIGNTHREATQQRNLGDVYYQIKEYGKAIECYRGSLIVWEELNDLPRQALLLNNLGGVFYQQQEIGQALSYFEKSLVFRRKSGEEVDIATTLWNIGVLHANLDQFDNAIKSLEEALVLFEKLDSPEKVEVQAWLERVRLKSG